MSAVIIYDDVDLAAKANAMLESAAHRSDEVVCWKVLPWRLDLFSDSPASATALTEATNANLIVLAMRRWESLPAGLLEWLEAWAMRRQVQDAALAMVGAGDRDELSAPRILDLGQFARRHGLNFIFDDGVSAEAKTQLFYRSLREREVGLTSTLEQISEQPVLGYYQHWGINE